MQSKSLKENKTSKYVRKECERHLRYLENGGKWVFDEELAHRPIRFIEKFVNLPKDLNVNLYYNHGNILLLAVCLVGFIKKQNCAGLKKL